uniref:Uncharacterized protein n=1 Tax=Anguilla anguilla TaxID=7936 RepID=A0A0E9WA58_ANGAN
MTLNSDGRGGKREKIMRNYVVLCNQKNLSMVGENSQSYSY